MRLLNIYQYLIPLVLFPLSYYLWLAQFHNHAFVWFMLAIPVLFAYIIPGLGTNWLKLWEFNTRLRLGRFRPHHGFVFGTATSLFGLFTIATIPFHFSLPELVRAGFVLGSVLAFWNWLYDIYALKVGFLVVYNRPYAQGLGAEATATAYAPVIFGIFGACYGITIRLGQHYLLDLGRWAYFWPLLSGSILATLVIPVLIFIFYSYLRDGETGLRAYYQTNGGGLCD